ncbi:MAG: DUF4394 domain-containing protein [Acidobacteriia bacterium]|nr:DUF4394 domain-containing protein [Terriglobia bacterium]
MAKVSVKGFSVIRDVFGASVVEIEVEHPETVGGTFDSLLKKYGAPLREVIVDPATGALLSSVPITAAEDPISIADLAIQPGTNMLFGVAAPAGGTAPPSQLYTINESTGAATPIGAPQAFFASIAFAPNGVLYESLADLDHATGNTINMRLQTLNPSTGAPTGAAIPTDLFFGALGVRPEDSVLFGGTGDQSGIYTINPATGQAIQIGNTGLNFVGDLAFTPIPEPATAAGMAAALLLLSLGRRRFAGRARRF